MKTACDMYTIKNMDIQNSDAKKTDTQYYRVF
jgi:hypothetical protein